MADVSTRVAHVLVIDDDPTVVEVLSKYLVREGYRVTTRADGLSGLDAALAELPDLVVLDLMLPGLNGVDLCRRLRAVAPVPVIMLTARGDQRDRISGLELGADDYVAKPFSPREVTARAKAVLRRASGQVTWRPDQAPLRAGRIEVDLAGREARLDGESAALTVKEFDLLAQLMRNPRRVYRREELLAEVWGFQVGDVSTVTVHVRRLREKIESDPSSPRHVRTVWGVGYRFDP